MCVSCMCGRACALVILKKKKHETGDVRDREVGSGGFLWAEMFHEPVKSYV